MSDLLARHDAVLAPVIGFNTKINAVSAKLMKKLGLDFKQTYKRLYDYNDPSTSGLDRFSRGDEFTFGGFRYKVEEQTGWFETAGWDSFVCIRGKAA